MRRLSLTMKKRIPELTKLFFAGTAQRIASISLRTKFVAGFCGLILFVGIALLLVASGELNVYLEHELDKRGTSIARHLADASLSPILTEDNIKLQLLLNDYMQNEEDIRYIYIVNTSKEVLAHTFGDTFPKDLLKTDHPILDTKKGHIQTIDSEDDRLKDVSAIILNGDLGRVHVGISESVIRTNLRAMVLYVLPYVAAILCLGIFLAVLFAATITRPIKALAQGARLVGGGKLDCVIEVDARDEIGELAATFNFMTRELRKKITEQQRVEEELHVQAALLEQEVAERQIAQEELAVKQQQLEILNQSLEERITGTIAEIRQKDQMLIHQSRLAAMGEMISNIAHQWRQPLNNVGLIIQNIQAAYDAGELTSDSMAKEVDDAMNVIFFMSHTIDDFRNFFQQDRVKCTFSVNRAVTRAIEFMMPGLRDIGVAVELEEEQTFDALGYANEYAQVLLNIINNAKDVFQERKPPEPRISIRVFCENSRSVVTVCDNGGGIETVILPKIFDPYFTTKDKAQGTGIGLYMSKVIIEQHMGGKLTARNVDEGAEFRVEL
jgi:nitrogen fixation/metabolism regulation signal transduction histidine kinase